MDRTDIKILTLLQRDGRISNQTLAEQVGLSTAACWRRVRALEQTGVIAGYAAILNRSQIQLQLCAFVHITLARHLRESTVSFEQVIRERPEVLECFATTGDADFILRVVTENIESLHAFLEDCLFALPQVAQVRSNIALRELKLATALPLAHLNP